MDFSALMGRRPWLSQERPSAVVLQEVLAAFQQLHRDRSIAMQVPPGPRHEHRLNAHAHAWPEVFFQISGERSFAIPGTRGLLLGGGQVALIPRGTEHHERISDTGHGHACLVGMCHPGRLSLHIAVRRPDGTQTGVHGEVFRDEGAGTDRLCDELALATDPGVRHALLTVLLAHASRVATGASLVQGGHPPLVDRCLRLVAVDLARPDLGVSDLARQLDCSADHLGRQFQKATGETLVSYVARRRIDLAVDLLADGRASVASVARACGFRDPAYFSRVFRRLRGTSPRGAAAKFPA
jgi:two-component system response regulator YesN